MPPPAHEEDIGEFAILDHRKADGSLSDAPVYNYNMVDSEVAHHPRAQRLAIHPPGEKCRRPRPPPGIVEQPRHA
jgi:hypothetical protein